MRCPERVRYQTRHQLGLAMLAESGASLPHAWVTSNDEMGRPYSFRRDLNTLGEQYLLAVPSNLLIRDLEAEPPPYCGRGPHPKVPFQTTTKGAMCCLKTRGHDWKFAMRRKVLFPSRSSNDVFLAVPKRRRLLRRKRWSSSVIGRLKRYRAWARQKVPEGKKIPL